MSIAFKHPMASPSASNLKSNKYQIRDLNQIISKRSDAITFNDLSVVLGRRAMLRDSSRFMLVLMWAIA